MLLNLKSAILNFCALILLINFSSCSTKYKIGYFKDLSDSGALHSKRLSDFSEPRVQVDDILSVSIQTIDPQINAQLNQAPVQVIANGSTLSAPQTTAGYWVNKEGFVELPLFGKIKVLDLTLTQIEDSIRTKARVIFKSPTVQVRYLNFRVSVLGEVNRPSTYTVTSEKVSIIDAIGLAGDLTIFGKRENVLVIREVNGYKEFGRVDLTSSAIFTSPYFYLRQNDLVYVEPNKARIAANNTPRNQTISITASLLALIITLITRL